MELNPNDLLKDRYRILGPLGKGGMGTVYHAIDTAVERQVAVKANYNPSETARRQFEREARLLAGLRHTNLPLVTDHFNVGEIQYLVMDYIPGDNLSERLKAQGAQRLEDILDWTKQLGSALTYLHSQSPPVIHRDIKPANIKITPDGKAVLVDFGIAKASEQAMTTTGARGYTPGFAPPEQYGTSSTGPYSDQYALAATMYAMLCGQSPVESIDRMLEREELIPPIELNNKISQHVNDVLMRALAVHPDQRFINVDEFVQSLLVPTFAPTLPRMPLTQTRPGKDLLEKQVKSGEAQASPWVKRSLVGLAAFAGISAVVVMALGGFTGSAKNPSPTPAATLPAPAVGSLPTATIAPLAATHTPSPALPTDIPSPTPAPTLIGQGGLIAFVSDRAAGGIFQIFTMRADGSDITQLTFDQTDKSQPTWSPDGKLLLYVADGGESFGTKFRQDIFVMDADGGNIINLTRSAGEDTDPQWSADGSKIAFTSTRNTNLKQIYFMNPDGSGTEFISRGFAVEYDPAWSPDGQTLVFSLSINDALPRLGKRTGAGLNPAFFDIRGRIGTAKQPDWSPDGSRIAFTGVNDGVEELFMLLVESGGGEITKLTTTLANRHPDWSPDGNWLVFTSNRDSNNEIYVINIFSQNQTNLTNSPFTDREPSWQPLP